MSDDDLASIDVRSGVNEDGEGFCTVVATASDGAMWLGQMTPTEVRAIALSWMEVAEAAEQDAAVLRVIRKIGMPDELAGAVIAELRNSRSE